MPSTNMLTILSFGAFGARLTGAVRIGYCIRWYGVRMIQILLIISAQCLDDSCLCVLLFL